MRREWEIAGGLSCWLEETTLARKPVVGESRATSERCGGSSGWKREEVRGDSIDRLTLHQCLRREKTRERYTQFVSRFQWIMYVPLEGATPAAHFFSDIAHMGMRVGNGEAAAAAAAAQVSVAAVAAVAATAGSASKTGGT